MSPIGSIDLNALVERMAGDAPTEATLQSEIHTLLLAADLNLSEDDVVNMVLESQSGQQRRIDVEVGHACIEVKKRLRPGRALQNAVDQLGAYVSERTDSLGQRYVGILTDGTSWQLYQLIDGVMQMATSYAVDPTAPDANGLLEWLAAVLATEERVAPTPTAIRQRLGASSSGYQLDQTELEALYRANRDRPEVAIKRELWAKLLTTALGTQFDTDDHELFVNHTLLVAMAETIAHAVLGFDVRELDAATLMGGDLFSRRALISGVVEHDFFDWPIECGDQGRRWVTSLARRLSQFEWAATSHDAMKTIYESIISPETRKALGEYYTPDFLAEHMVKDAVISPLNSRVLDPSCGSGTFLFHAVRRYLKAAQEAGHSNTVALQGVVGSIAGIDLHPVAVTLARVTYLLAIGTDRLQDPDRPALRIPVFIGDSIEWGQRQDLFSSETLNVDTDDGYQMFADQLRFPQALLDDADRFDRLVTEMAEISSSRDQGSTKPSFTSIARRHGLAGPELEVLQATFETMCRLHDEGRNHIWGYFVRNLARPAWFARPNNRVDVIIGNPPWLAYRFMTEHMKARYRQLATDRGLWAGGDVATQQDLSDLFVARAIERYLRPGGRFTFVMPAAVLTRGQFSGFRSAKWAIRTAGATAQFDTCWDFSAVTPYFFPRTCAVVRGSRSAQLETYTPLGSSVLSWSGSIPDVTAPWEEVAKHLTQVETDVAVREVEAAASPYGERFTNGATVFPRVLTTVTEDRASPVGAGAGRVPIRSDRGTYEKKPWKELQTLEGVVERQFVHPLLMGECLLPFRQIDGPMAVLPITSAGKLIDPDEYPGLADWWQRASEFWNQHRTSSMSLLENLNYRNKLKDQFPLSPHRVVVAHSAMHVAACRVRLSDSVVEHQLDWAGVRSEGEALYLCAVLNTPALTTLATPYMTSGKGGGRHIGKSLWRVPVPLFDETSELHLELAAAGHEAEGLVAGMELPNATHGTLRRQIRAVLARTETGRRLDELVAALLKREP